MRCFSIQKMVWLIVKGTSENVEVLMGISMGPLFRSVAM